MDANADGLQPAGKKIFQTVEASMTSMAYGEWKVMLYESLVRASVVRYLQAHTKDSNLVKETLRNEKKRGFIWMDELVQLLGQYENSRTKYPTLQTFIPEMIRFYNGIADRIEAMKTKYESSRPKVAALQPFVNGTKDVDPSITEIIVQFDRPLDPDHMSVRNLYDAAMPVVERPVYFNNNQSLRMKVRLQPGKQYGFVLGDQNFYTTDGFPLREYTVRFSTRP